MSSRAEILDLISGKRVKSQPSFSGLIHVTLEGLERAGLSLRETHHEAAKMARAAASTFRLTGMPSASLPLDLCAPAEAVGAELNFESEGFPQVKKAFIESTKEIGEFGNREWEGGRIGLIVKAIELVKDDIGRDVVISGAIPGPYTLLLYLCSPGNLFFEMKKEPQMVKDALFHLSAFLSNIGRAYRQAGADFITIHDMGGSPGFIGPARYEQFVLPAEKSLIEKLPKPVVLSVCGNVTGSLDLLKETGAAAISIDQTIDITKAREVLKDTLLFGNIDPVQTLWQGNKAQVVEAVQRARGAGVDAVWPGCDLVPQSPIENIRVLSGA